MRPNLKALVITGYPNADRFADCRRYRNTRQAIRRDTLIAGVTSLLGEMRPLPDETAELIDNRDLNRRT